MMVISGSELRIELLGGFCVARGEAEVDEAAWRLRKARGLLKLLALTPEHALHREAVIEALWPEREASAASNNLRQALFVARRALDSCGDDGAARLEHAQDLLTLRTEHLSIDVEHFEAAAEAAERAPSLESYRAALALYGGELLPEDRFEPWATGRREALRERHLNLLIGQAGFQERAGDEAGALASLQQALVQEPLHELAHRELMHLYALTGRRQRALAQFHLLRESLRREFEDEPGEETRRLYQEILTRRLGEPESPDPAPAARRVAQRHGATGNLPLQLTSFIGRQRELGEVVGLARRHRLLTLTGPGGSGKTRLALEAAGTFVREVPDGVWLVELAGISDGELVGPTVGRVLLVESRSARPSEQAIAAHIAERTMLIVLDNCEHLIASCARLVAGLLSVCPNLRILATSREPLHTAGEVNWRMPSLTGAEAERLFCERASNVSSRFALTEENTPAVREICRRVEGIPLAIELAAARVGVLAPGQIAERLRDSLSVLAASGRAGLTRQQTLRATLDWSYGLLHPEERVLLGRLAAFAESFDLAAVEAVCEGELDVLERLVDKSLVVVEDQDGIARYRLLDTVRQYGRERLAEAGEPRRLEEAHRSYYLDLAEQLEPEAETPPARQRLAREADEMRWSLRTALRAEPAVALRLCAALWRFWHDRGDRTEGVGWIEATLRTTDEPSLVRARALHGLSVLALRTNDHRRALETADEAVDIARRSGDRQALIEELHHLGALSWVFADNAAAERYCRESQSAAEEVGDEAGVASVLHTLGVLEVSRNEIRSGSELITESIERLRALPDDARPLVFPVALGYGRVARTQDRPPRMFLENTFVTARRIGRDGAVGYGLCDLAAAAQYLEDEGRARELLEEALALFWSTRDDLGRAQALAQLGNLLALESEHEAAREVHEESLALRTAANDARGIGLSLMALAVGALQAGEIDRGRRCAGQALASFERTDDGPGRAAAVSVLGYLARAAGKLEQARDLQQQAFTLWGGFIPHTGWNAGLLLEMAELDSALGEFERVPARLGQAREIASHLGDRATVDYCERTLRDWPANATLTPE